MQDIKEKMKENIPEGMLGFEMTRMEQQLNDWLPNWFVLSSLRLHQKLKGQ